MGATDAFEAPLPGRWGGFLARFLTCTVDLVKRDGTDNFGQPAPGRRYEQVPCWIDGQRSRQPTEGSQDRRIDYQVVFHREMDVEPEDALENARDVHGRPLFAKGRVVQVDPTNHPEFGELVRTAAVSRN